MASDNDILRIAAKQRLQGQEVMNVYHLFLTDGAPDWQVADDCVGWVSTVHNYHAQMASDALTFTSIEVYNETAETFLGEYPYNALTDGNLSQDPLPNGVAGLITFPTALAKTRGRKFYAGLSELLTTQGLFVGIALTQLTNIAGFALLPYLGVFSGSYLVPGVRTSTGGFQVFTAALLSNIPAYQRRRKQGVGV